MLTAAAVLALTIAMGTGCGTEGKEEPAEEEAVTETDNNSASEVMESTPSPIGEAVQEDDDTAEDEAEEEKDAGEDISDIYGSILDRFYYQITGSWDRTDEISYMFYWDYTYVQSPSDAGYMLTDMNGDGIEELLVSTVKDAEHGLIYDLYTCVDGEAVHIASSGERTMYNLCGDGTILYEGSSGASNSIHAAYGIAAEDGLLKLKEVVRYDADQDKDNPWFYGTDGQCYDGENGFDYGLMSQISEEEAQGIIDSYEISPLELALFDGYTPKGDMPVSMSLKAAYKSAIGSETDLFFECLDYDGNGTEEAFGVTGVDDGMEIWDFKLYYITLEGEVSCIATLDTLFGFGGMSPAGVMDTGSAKFLVFGGSCGQETWLYGIRDGELYQPEVSGQHSDFFHIDGKYIAMPHEGGEGFYEIIYDFDPVTGEFVEQNAE